MSLSLWSEFRTAYHVARLGKVSLAADHLGVHHATVIRHIDAIERQLGVPLFQRHARGYTPTEAGRALLATGRGAEEMLAQFVARVQGSSEVAGELILTTVPSIDRLVLPVIAAFQEAHPLIRLRYLSDARLYRLAAGEAHLALRAGERPDAPDDVVRPLAQLRARLVAAKSYIARHRAPESLDDLQRHRFIRYYDDESRGGFSKWLERYVPEERFVLSTAQPFVVDMAVREGMAIGFTTVFTPGSGADADLVELLPTLTPPEWLAPLWLVTHVDLHRLPKVQAFSAALIEAARRW